MKKYLMMALICLMTAGCSKEEEDVQPKISDAEIAAKIIGTNWHEDNGYVNSWMFTATEYDSNLHHFGYKNKLAAPIYRFSYGHLTELIYHIADNSIHIAALVSRGEDFGSIKFYYCSYDEYCTLTPISITDDEMTAIRVYHNTKSLKNDRAEKPETVKFLRGVKQ